MKLPALALSALGLLAAGCGTSLLPPPEPDHTQFFVLSGPPPAPSQGSPESGAARVGINLPFDIPDYLSGRTIVVRTSANQLALNDYERWGESLQDGILRVVENQLSSDPAVGGVVAAPFPLSAQPRYVISIRILRCEGDTGSAGGGADFAASYRIQTTDLTPKLVASGTYVAPPAAWDGRDFGRLAALLSTDVEDFAQALAAGLPH